METLKRSFILLALFALFGFSAEPVFAIDQNDEYPSPMWGPVTVTESPNTPQELTFYSQADGSEIIRNVAATTGDSPNLLFDVVGKRFYLSGNFSGQLKLLSSRTFVNGGVKASTAVLRQVGVNVFGDSFNSSGNFAYWGQHLRQTDSNNSTSSNAFWQQPAYQINPLAQVYWNGGNNQAMTDTIGRLMQNAKTLPTGTITGLFDGICYPAPANSCPEANQFSDGRVWYKDGPVAISGGTSFSNKSTIIVENGDLNITGSLIAGDQNSSIGFIVENGNVTISNSGSKISASIFAPKGKINVAGNNIDLTGSFVAENFTTNGSGINFIADSRGENVWPPGFRDLIPLSVTSK